MTFLAELNLSLPFKDPVVIFTLVLFIILFAPILFDKVKIPHIIGLIIAGIIVGPYGFNLLARDSSIVLFGTVGLLYIMFMAGLEIDLEDFKKNALWSVMLGLFTFLIPISIGFFASYYLLGYSLPTSILMASTFASFTLVSYPIISKYGLANNKAVNITVGSVMITDLMTLLVLAIVVGMAQGQLTSSFWTRLSVSVIIMALIIVFLFPLIARWFFKRFNDGISQYIFVLAMVFLGGFMAEAAGIEAIIGAFLAGISINKFIPHNSALMNRIGFVGNAIFIPFFLVSTGMLVNIGQAFTSLETLKVAGLMIGGALIGKYLASKLAQKIIGLNKTEGMLIFGLSAAQAAATLATVLVGYSVILGESPTGQPIRLLNENILNGTILLVLVSCTVSSLVVEKASKKLLKEEESGELEEEEHHNKTLISINNPEYIDALVDLSVMMSSPKDKKNIFAVNVLEAKKDDPANRKSSDKLLNAVKDKGASYDVSINTSTRFDKDVPTGLSFTLQEHKITDLILKAPTPSGNKNKISPRTAQILAHTNQNVIVYYPAQPLNTLKRIVVVVNMRAQVEIGFQHWVNKMFTLSKESGLPLVFYATKFSQQSIQEINKARKKPLTLDFRTFTDWDEFYVVAKDLNKDDLITIISSRPGYPSYHKRLAKIPYYLFRDFKDNSRIMIYPEQEMSHAKISELWQGEKETTLGDIFSRRGKLGIKAGHLLEDLLKTRAKDKHRDAADKKEEP